MSGPPATAHYLRTPLYAVHVALGAKMVPFAGYEMPVQYPPGVLKEHLWTREKAGLFDVSHMGQAETGRSRRPPARWKCWLRPTFLG
jgi:aminomethyltransferase